MPIDPYIGTIMPFAGNFAPRNWSFCNGQLVSINTNQALFSLIGTFFGGDGRFNFALPDLRGRCAVGFGQGPFLTARNIGDRFGNESVALLATQIPPHTHTMRVVPVEATTADPTQGLIAKSAGDVRRYGLPTPQVAMSPAMLGPAGSNQPHPNMQPSLTMNYIIAMQGIFPSRP
jgi:microcystin-dependent protein